MAGKSVLILGGNGKISRLLTPILLGKGFNVTSVVRAEDQVAAIKALRPSSPTDSTLNVLVRSLEDVKSEADAQSVIHESKPDYVFWSAGAGGKGTPERTFTVDRDAASFFIKAAAATPAVKLFLLVSYLGSRRSKPAWWSDDAWASAVHVNTKVLPRYYEAKIAADEVLYRESRKRQDFAGICLRPGTLTDAAAARVQFGKTTTSTGNVSRASVAEVAAEILSLDDGQHAAIKNSWLDLLDGETDVAAAVELAVRDKVDAAEGEPVFEEKEDK